MIDLFPVNLPCIIQYKIIHLMFLHLIIYIRANENTVQYIYKYNVIAILCLLSLVG